MTATRRAALRILLVSLLVSNAAHAAPPEPLPPTPRPSAPLVLPAPLPSTPLNSATLPGTKSQFQTPPRPASPAPLAPPSARFALIIGVNKSVDSEATSLRYADDDAARYLDLFRSLGARSYVLARLDDNTQRIHPQAAAEAVPPTRVEFSRAIDRLAVDLAQARERGVPTVLYFVYAGHGTVKNERGYISLEDARLGAVDLETEVVDKLHADQTHFIVDACYSYFLVTGRGPGGHRREVHGFSQLGGLATRPGVGLLLSTSSARESHEWAGFQAGVFSHEVRSGLYGAADADGDGQVTYREMVAFIERANAAVANERYRPDVFARAANDSGVFVDLRDGQRRRIDVRGTDTGHYYLEDTLGVRVADFNKAEGQSVSLLRPATVGPLYLRRAADETEYVIPPAPDVVEIAALTPERAPVQSRGAANDAFNKLFSLPFRAEDVLDLRLRAAPDLVVPPDDSSPVPWTRYAGMSLVGASVVSGAAGVITLLSAGSLKNNLGTDPSQLDVANVNDKIAVRKLVGGLELGVAGVTAFTGLALLLWPSTQAPVSADISLNGGMIHFHAGF
jgi:hypothetical protein